MRTILSAVGFAAIVLALPLSWWLVERARRDPQARLGMDNRAKVDTLSAGTGVGAPPGGGFSA